MLWDILIFLGQAVLVFIASTALFDALHWLLHRWEKSPKQNGERQSEDPTQNPSLPAWRRSS